MRSATPFGGLLSWIAGNLERTGLRISRTADDVLDDLLEAELPTVSSITRDRGPKLLAQAEKPAPGHIVLVTAGIVCLRLAFGIPSISGFVVTTLMAISLGYLAAQALARQRQHQEIRQLEFHLPIVMERIVMAVQAGHDIISGMRVVLSLDESPVAEEKLLSALDPVTTLLKEVLTLAESGLSIEQSLTEVSQRVPCSALRHAFIHLSQAHKEGGELVMPLRELSDSTQLYYQESIEEEIAKMPVKATLPLLCTFAGLIIFFLTSPLLQVMEITSKAMPK